jgi:hypothetical protein
VIFLTHTRLPDALGGGRGGGFHVHRGWRARYSASARVMLPDQRIVSLAHSAAAETASAERRLHFLCDERVRLALAGDNLTVMVDTP